MVTRRELLARDVPATLIDDRLRSRRLVLLHRGVYALGHAQLTTEGWWAAAVGAYRPPAALSHHSAAGLWDIHEGPRWPIHVVLGGRAAARARRGIRPHRRPSLATDELAVVRAIPVTTVARTLLDLAGHVPGRVLEQAVRRASRRRVFDLGGVQELLDRNPRAHGATELGRLIAALDGRGTIDARSRLEVAFAQLCDDHALPRPQVNAIVLGERVDFSWSSTTLVVETDGFEFHAMPTTFAADRRRDQKLTLAGYTVVRLTYDQVVGDPAGVARTISALLTRCRVR